MSLIQYIKSLFGNNLSSIIAPLEKIQIRLDNYIEKVGDEIMSNNKKMVELRDANTNKAREQDAATKVKDNLKTLLGKI